ncbi:MAG: OsmC family protein [Chlamydiales bacterium]|nr:OsmC family protein [Chlamydiales bacterium]
MTLKKDSATSNGVDVKALRETCDVLKKNPELGQSYFRVHNTWEEGGQNRVNVSNFYAAGEEQVRKTPYKLQADEPPALLGHDKGPNPVEYLLAALSSCMTTSIVYHAAARGIEIDSLESDFKGDLDLRGFLDLSKEVPKGYQKIEAIFRVKTDASVKEIEELYKFSPVYSMVSKSVPIEVKIVKE